LFNPRSSQVAFDARTGALTRISLISAARFGEKLDAIVTPLHFGTFGGKFSQAAYAIAGLALPLVSMTGLVTWWKRRRARSRPPRLRPAPTTTRSARA
jgi:uncharacterized iron-regulated membrane protein